MDKIIKSLSSLYLLTGILIVSVIVLVIGSLCSLEYAISTVYSSFYFKFLILALIVNIIFCLARHINYLLKNYIFTIIHVSLIIIILGGFVSSLYASKSFIKLGIGEITNIAINNSDQFIELPFSIRLKTFKVEKYDEKSAIILKFLDKNYQIIKEYSVQEGDSFKIPGLEDKINISQISKESDLITNVMVNIKGFKRWVGTDSTAYIIDEKNETYMLFISDENSKNIKAFKSQVEVIKDNNIIETSTIEVNKPLIVDGYKLYQYSYDKDNGLWSGIMAKKDPGTKVVFTGYLLLVIGVILNLFKTFNNKEVDSE